MNRMKNIIRSAWIRAQCAVHDDRGISVIELILVLVGIFTPYYGVGIRCMT